MDPARRAVLEDAIAAFQGAQGLTVDAGPDRLVLLPETEAALDASVTGASQVDTRLLRLPVSPSTPLSVSWSQVSGPEPVVFDPVDAADTTVTLPGPGTYVLELAADDGGAPVTDQVTITVREAGRNIALIAGTTNPPSGDRPIHQALLDDGHDVTIIDDDALATTDLTTIDLIVITSSVVPSKIGTLLTTAPIPIAIAENYLFDDFALSTEATTAPTTTSDVHAVKR